MKYTSDVPFYPAFSNDNSPQIDLNFMLTARISEGSREEIQVYVLDLEIKNG